jgi:2-polyprenyl-3-methyl-5-hydroxy-6-metoxy-1,4-benzoquinol methylase
MDSRESSMEEMTTHSIPPCPICGDTNVILYGQQQYLVPDGSIPSVIFRCPSCDLNFRRFDRPLSKVTCHFKVAPYSTDEIEQRWLKRRLGFYEFLLDMLSKPADGKSLLDIGCAFGHFMDCAVSRGYRPFGTEVSEDMADLLRKRKNYSISTEQLSDLQLPEKQFDVITFVDSFYYFENPLETLQQCKKLLKPGGELLMRVTNRNGLALLHRLANVLRFRGDTLIDMPFWTTDDAVCCHSWKSLTILMKKTGFKISRLTCVEKGKRMDSLGLRAFYSLTSILTLLTFHKVRLTPGIICLAVKE